MVHPYIYCPFPGVVCTICHYPISDRLGSYTIPRAIARHKDNNKKHTTKLTQEEREEVNREFLAYMTNVAKQFVQNPTVNFFIGTYLIAVKKYPFCSECNSPVFDKSHKRNLHQKYCCVEVDGYTTTTWQKKQPKVYPAPLNINDENTFCPEFWHCCEIEKKRICMTVGQQFQEIYDNQHTVYEYHLTQEQAQPLDPKAQPNLYITRAGWDRYLNGFNLMDICNLADNNLDGDIDNLIVEIIDKCKDVLLLCVKEAQQIENGHFVLVAVKGKVPLLDVSTKPFNANLENESWDRYIGRFLTILKIIFRMEYDNTNYFIKLPSILNDEQRRCIEIIKNDHNANTLCYVRFMYSLINQEIYNDAYDCIVLGAMAAMSVKSDLTYLAPNDASQIYAAVLAVSRVIILYLVKHDRPAGVEYLQYAKQITKDTMALDEFKPLSWIIHTFCYFKTVASETVSGSPLRWDGETLWYKTMKLSMTTLKSVIINKVNEATDLLLKLVYCGCMAELPPVDWGQIFDNISNCANGYSFLVEPCNDQWIRSGDKFVMNQITNNYDLLHSWFDGETRQIIANQFNKYDYVLKKFREILLCLIHITGGQPARGPELLNITFRNTSTNRRNVYFDRGHFCIEVHYHKSMVQHQSIKQVFRYLPKKVSNLLLHYLWLVVPFYQHIKGHLKESIFCHPYLWSKEMVAEEINFDSDNNIATTSLSLYLDSFFSGIGMNVSSWRQIAIAIGRKYIKNDIFDPTDDSDDVLDLAATHGTRIGYQWYGRLSTDNQFAVQNRIDAFRDICIRWHLLLLNDNNNNILQNNYDITAESRMARETRIIQLASWVPHLDMMLKKFTGNPSAEYRGNQKEALTNILERQPIILQIAATGVGKSISFMLPAMVSVHGCTVVVVPLVSLEEDLLRRCREKGIRATIFKNSNIPVFPYQIVFVTPESASTNGFYQYIQLLISNSTLDRIVVDECHLLLTSTDEFRPTMTNFKRLIHATGVQLVLLTATLPMNREDELFKSLDLSREKIKIVRGATVRTNIRYIVESLQYDRKMIVMRIQEMLKTVIDDDKVIIYVRTIDMGNWFAENLSLHFYHNKAGTVDEKQAMIRNWIRNERCIVATNALGCGLDIPNIRLVIHIGSPNALSDYVQESGRCGRDGRSSTATLLHFQKKFTINDEMKLYIQSKQCRRFIINQVMDGCVTCDSCLTANIEQCDLCKPDRSMMRKRRRQIEESVLLNENVDSDESNIGENIIDENDDNESDDQIDITYEEEAVGGSAITPRQVQRIGTVTPATVVALQRINVPMQAAISTLPFATPTVAFAQRNDRPRTTINPYHPSSIQMRNDRPIIPATPDQSSTVQMRLVNEENVSLNAQQTIHEEGNLADYFKSLLEKFRSSECFECTLRHTNTCANEHKQNVAKAMKSYSSMKGLIRHNETMQSYSGCFTCYVPQSICYKKPCRYNDIILPVILLILQLNLETYDELPSDVLQKCRYFGRKLHWNGLETCNMVVVFTNLCNKLRINK